RSCCRCARARRSCRRSLDAATGCSPPHSSRRSSSRAPATAMPTCAKACNGSRVCSSATCGAHRSSGPSSRISGMGRADLQLHSDLGDGLASPEAILDAAERVGLDVIALTDHDDIRGAFLLRDIAARRSSPVEIIPGVEVTTRSGHLLALWIEEEIPMFAALAATVSGIHLAGGVAIVPHPLSYLTFSVGAVAVHTLAAAPDPFVDGDVSDTRTPASTALLPGADVYSLDASVVDGA